MNKLSGGKKNLSLGKTTYSSTRENCSRTADTRGFSRSFLDWILFLILIDWSVRGRPRAHQAVLRGPEGSSSAKDYTPDRSSASASASASARANSYIRLCASALSAWGPLREAVSAEMAGRVELSFDIQFWLLTRQCRETYILIVCGIPSVRFKYCMMLVNSSKSITGRMKQDKPCLDMDSFDLTC